MAGAMFRGGASAAAVVTVCRGGTEMGGWRAMCASMRTDREVVLEAVARNGSALGHASVELRADRELVMVAISNDGWALQFASPELQKDREIVLEAIRQDGRALEYAGAEPQADRQIVLEAIRQNGYALRYARSSSERIARLHWLLCSKVAYSRRPESFNFSSSLSSTESKSSTCRVKVYPMRLQRIGWPKGFPRLSD